jgi:hypothetical protein
MDLNKARTFLGWADFRVTNYAQIQKWWEVVISAYLLVSLHADVLNPRGHSPKDNISKSVLKKFSIHDWWDEGQGWKNLLNNLRLVLQPFGFFNLIKPWLKVFSIPTLSVGFERLIGLMNLFSGAVPIAVPEPAFLFSSA